MISIRRAAASLVLGTLLALIVPTAAQAHATLATSNPPPGAVLQQAPGTVTLTFTEAVQPVTDRVRVLAPDNTRVDDNRPRVTGSTLTIAVDSDQQGTYLVSYRVISTDSHPVAGSFTYSVGAPSVRTAADADAPVEADPVVRMALPLVKLLGYLGLLLTVGPLLVLALLWPHRLDRTGPARLARTGFGLIAAATLLGLWLQIPYTTGGGLFAVTGTALRDVLGSRFGVLMLIRLAVTVVAIVVAAPLLHSRHDPHRVRQHLLLVLTVAGLATWPLAGHPAGSPVPAVSVVIDALHLSAMSVWLGGLVMLLLFLLPRATVAERAAIMPIWSRWAATAVGVLLFTGTVQALIEVGSPGALTGTDYGRLLLIKVVLVAVALSAAAAARRVMRRRDDGGVTPLRRLIGGELLLTAAVLAVTSVLVQTPPGRAATAAPVAPASDQQVQTLQTRALSLQVVVFPARVGNNSVHLYAYTPDGSPLTVVEWTATAALPSAGIEPIDIPLLRITDNHAIGDIALPSRGQWQMTFTLRTSDVDQDSVEATVTIG